MLSYGTLPEWLTAVIAGAALVFARGQIQAAKSISYKSSANEAWNGFVSLAFANPQFGTSQLALEHADVKSISDLVESENLECERYQWFVTILLDACEEIVIFAPKSKEWRTAIEEQLKFHEPFLSRVWNGEGGWSGFYSPKLRQIIREASNAHS